MCRTTSRKCMPAALVADPAGDADIQAEIEIGARLVDPGGEAMRDAAARRADIAQDRQEILVRVALMQEDRLAHSRRAQLLLERVQLRLARRKIPKVVEAAFADRDHFGLARQLARSLNCAASSSDGVMRMNAGRAAQALRIVATSAMAACVLASELPVITMRVTPTSAARWITASRSCRSCRARD